MLQVFKRIQQITAILLAVLVVYALAVDLEYTRTSLLLVWLVFTLQSIEILDLQALTKKLQNQISDLKYRIFKEHQD